MAKKIKILQVCRLTPLWGMDLFKEITHAYRDEKYEITTVFLAGKPNPQLLKEYTGNVIFFHLNHRAFSYRLLAFYKLLQLCRRQHFDVILCHHYKPTVLVNAVAWLCPVPQLFSIHHNLDNFKRSRRKWVARKLFHPRWKFITVSERVKQDLLNAQIGLTPEKILTLHNSINIQEVQAQQYSRAESRKQLHIPEDSFVFGTIGRLVPVKGHRYLLEAYAKHLPYYPHAYLVIIGGGLLRDELQQRADELGIQQQVLIADHLAANAFKYLKAFDVFVFPSLQEGFGIALLEAMAAHLPIIASTAGGIPEALGNSGIQFTPGDTEALANALLDLYQLPLAKRQALAQQSHQQLIENFSIAHYHSKFQSIIN